MGASSGANFQAESYRSSAQSVMQAASFNIGVVNVNLARNLNDLSRSIPKILGTQRAQAAGSGFSVASKSFQAIFSESLDTIERQADHVRQDAELERQRIWFEAQSQAAALENQARAAELQGRLASSRAIQSTISGISRLF